MTGQAGPPTFVVKLSDEERQALQRGRSSTRALPLWFPPNRGGLLYAASRSGAVVVS